MKQKTLTATTFVGIILAGLATSLAWACTSQTILVGLSVESGAPGSLLTANGKAVRPGAAVAIHWNGVSGQPLGAATADSAGNYAISVKIPDVVPNIYYVVVSEAGGGVARQAFEVTAGMSQRAPSDVRQSAAGISSDLWRGLAAKTDVSAPAMLESPRHASGPGTAAGVALAGIGITALFAGLGLLASGRRRAISASAGSRQADSHS